MRPIQILFGKNDFGEHIGEHHVPISLLLLASYVKRFLPKESYEIEIFDFRLENPTSIEDKLQSLRDNGILCISNGSSYEYLDNMKIFSRAKEINQKILTVVGGYHPLVVPQDYAFQNSPVDCVIQGEGELPLMELIQDFARHPVVPATTQIIRGKPTSDLNSHPIVEWALYEKYLKLFPNQLLVDIIISRGCAFNCAFCVEKSKEIPCWRSYSPSRAIQEIDAFYRSITSMGLDVDSFLSRRKFLIIADVCFGYKAQWTELFLKEFKKKDFPFGLFVETRCDVVSKAILPELKKIPSILLFGFETASKQQLYLLNKTPDPVRYINKCSEIIQITGQLEVPVSLNLLVGTPGENLNTLGETVKFLERAIKVNPFLLPNLPTAYSNWPGTLLFENMHFFEHFFGSKFYFKKYWQAESPHFHSKIIDASRTLTFVNLVHNILEVFYPIYKDLVFLNPKAQNLDQVTIYGAFKNLKRTCKKLENLYSTLNSNGETPETLGC